jgi:hypothetical protein
MSECEHPHEDTESFPIGNEHIRDTGREDSTQNGEEKEENQEVKCPFSSLFLELWEEEKPQRTKCDSYEYFLERKTIPVKKAIHGRCEGCE